MFGHHNTELEPPTLIRVVGQCLMHFKKQENKDHQQYFLSVATTWTDDNQRQTNSRSPQHETNATNSNTLCWSVMEIFKINSAQHKTKTTTRKRATSEMFQNKPRTQQPATISNPSKGTRQDPQDKAPSENRPRVSTRSSWVAWK